MTLSVLHVSPRHFVDKKFVHIACSELTSVQLTVNESRAHSTSSTYCSKNVFGFVGGKGVVKIVVVFSRKPWVFVP